jgi:cytochrome c
MEAERNKRLTRRGTGEIEMGPRHLIDAMLRLPALAVMALALGPTSGEAADIAKGQAAFVRQCAICHTIDKGGENRVGPNLFGVIGRRAGAAPDFKYTNAFRNTATFEWTEGLLGPWIALPAVMVPGTAMGVFPGVSDRDKDDIVAYIAAQK